LGVAEAEGVPFAKALRERIGISKVVLHEARFACDDLNTVFSPFTPLPLLTTGAGDNFNAGYLNAMLYGWSMEEALTLGIYTASFYVSKGKSPTREELALFLEERLN
jgi:sugar/nucleoside kinase (ribokinase family)